jgi:undecaprenyl-diphosphatase
MLKPILNFDRSLFRFINQDCSNGVFDVLMPFLRNQYTWVPVYIFLLVFMLVNFRNKAIWWVLFFLASFAVSDLATNQLIKAWFQRPRPCVDAATYQWVRMLIPCSSSYGFVSSHASNHFAISAFSFFTMRQFAKPWIWLFYVWAALVCIAQVYVGAHFPFDVMGGAMFGLLIGWRMATIFNQRFGGLQPAQMVQK